jgi:N4-gp56 family major capsid protein
MTAFASGDPRTQTKWSKAVFEYALPDLYFMRMGMMAKGPEGIIVMNSDLEKGPGDQLITEMQVPLSGVGIGNDGKLKDNPESIVMLNQATIIGERGHSVESAGKISEKRTAFNVRTAARSALGTWYREAMEDDIVRALAGMDNVGLPSNNIATVNAKTPSTNRHLLIGQSISGTQPGTLGTGQATVAALSALTAADTQFGVKVIKRAKRMAKLATPKIQPVRINGKDYYVMLIHPYQAESLKNDFEWIDAQKRANLRGSDNPLFTGALGEIDGVLIHEYDRTPYRTGAGGTDPAEGFTLNAARTATTDAVANGRTVARALFLGRQASVIAWGQRPRWYEDYADVNGRLPLVGVDCMYATTKARFRQYDSGAGSNTDQEDLGIIAVDTQVVV